jgi:hypothetical protein
LLNELCNDFSINARADSTRRLSEAKLCEIVGVSQQYRQSLARRKLVDRAGRSGCTRTDAIELAALERLSHHLSPNEVVVAWRQLRQQLRETLPGGQLDVVFDRALGTATTVRSDAELRAAVVSGRAVIAVELSPRLQEVLDAFNRWTAAAAPPAEPAARRRGASRPA